jgi:hypothetical protein
MRSKSVAAAGTGIAHQTGVGRCRSCQAGDVLRMDPSGVQAWDDAQALAKMGEQRTQGGAVLRVVPRHLDPHGQGEVSVALGCPGKVELHHWGQQQGIAFAVGKIQKSAKAMGQGMDRAEAGVGKGNTRVEAGEHGVAPGLELVGMGDGLGQGGDDAPDSLESMDVGKWTVGSGDVGLYGMS